MYYRKYIIYFPFIIGFWLLFENKKFVIAFIILISLIIISAGALPGIYSGILLYILINLRLKKLTKKQLLKVFTYSTLMVVFWFVFYFFTSNKSISVNNLNELFSITTWKNIETYKRAFNIYTLTSLQYFLYFLPFIGLFLIVKKDVISKMIKHKNIPQHLLLLIILFFTSLSCWAFMSITGNARQFFSNGFAIIIIIWLSIYLSKELSKSRVNIFVLLILILTTGNNIIMAYKNNSNSILQENSDDYLNKVCNSLNNINKEIILGGIIYSKEEISHITQRRDKAFHIYPLAHYTNFALKTVDVQNLSIYDAPPLKDTFKENRFKHLIEITPFYQFVEKQKSNNRYSNIQNSQLDFIKKNSLSFIVVRKNAKIPNNIKPDIQEVILDSMSGDQFVILK